MKKTLIALALTATAASGSAMAWTANGTGGTVEFSGTLTPLDKITPWEVLVGAPVSNLDANVEKGRQSVDITTKAAIPVLGIRTQSTTPFLGSTGIAPQIDYHNAIDVNNFKKGQVPLTLNVMDETGTNKIGVLSTSLLAAGEFSQVHTDGMTAPEKYTMIAPQSGMGFFGGLPTSEEDSASNAITALTPISPEYFANYNSQGADWGLVRGGFNYTPFWVDARSTTFSAFYGSGILSGSDIKITLDHPAQGDAPIKWKASLPITVSYM